jgi:2-polyprenyl-3-methyl-5-hydroxy-6-metoxy-1,4-benzoquinol methylase
MSPHTEPAGTAEPSRPNPERIFETLNAYQKTAALKTAIELDVFTAVGEGATTHAALANRCQTSERGMRILCDFLVIHGFLTKNQGHYGLTPESGAFLDRRSPTYVGAAAKFLALPELMNLYYDLPAIVRAGGSIKGEEDTAKPDSAKWVEFARSMSGLQRMQAEGLASMLNAGAGEKWKVLDIAAGHGMYGVTIAKQNPNAEIFALDWPQVLQVAEENARAAGVAARHHKLPGSAFDVDFGKEYDIVLLTGFLHHFDQQTIISLLRKVHAALKPGGRAVTAEFVPNEDRVTPPAPAAFSMIMLGTTRSGDAYTMSEYDAMFRQAGFGSNEKRQGPGPQSFIISRK